MREHRLEQITCTDEIIGEVRLGPLHTLTDEGIRREMEDGIGAVLSEHPPHRVAVEEASRHDGQGPMGSARGGPEEPVSVWAPAAPDAGPPGGSGDWPPTKRWNGPARPKSKRKPPRSSFRSTLNKPSVPSRTPPFGNSIG